jgi:murein DD-endopeptidase MepM/ murein hydrolase activator NlpD
MIECEKIKKQLKRQLTVMLIPHSDMPPIRLSFSMAFLVLMVVAWTGLTLWSGYIASRHINYWRARTDQQVMRAKVWYMARELKHSQEYIDHVRETEMALENLLKMKTRSAIVQSNGVGGPTNVDLKQLSNQLTGRQDNVTVQDVHDQLAMVKQAESDVTMDFQEISRYIKDQHDLWLSTPLSWPTEGHVTSPFGVRKLPGEDEDFPGTEFHRGIDIANRLGTPVHATADGIIRIASWQGGYGRLIIIDHGHGFQTYYAHNSRLLVKPGDAVKRGQVISYMGTSGHSTGYHLHYEVWQNGRVVNPMRFVKAQSDN